MRTQALDQGPSTFYQKLEMTKILEFYFGKIFVREVNAGKDQSYFEILETP